MNRCFTILPSVKNNPHVSASTTLTSLFNSKGHSKCYLLLASTIGTLSFPLRRLDSYPQCIPRLLVDKPLFKHALVKIVQPDFLGYLALVNFLLFCAHIDHTPTSNSRRADLRILRLPRC